MPGAPRRHELNLMIDHSARYRRLSVADIMPKPPAPVTSGSGVTRFAAKLADAMSESLAELGGGLWRVTLDRIDDKIAEIWDETGAWFRVESHRGSMRLHMAFDRAAFSAVCEVAMGGSASEPLYEFPERPLSNIEKDILAHALERLTGCTAHVLGEHLEVPVRQFEDREDSESSAISDLVTCRFLANLNGYSGEIRLTALQSEIAAQFAPPAMEESNAGREGRSRINLQHRISSADIGFTVTLGPEMMVVDDVATLSRGKLLRLTSTTATPVVLRSDGNPVFSATLLRTGDRMAIRLLAPIA